MSFPEQPSDPQQPNLNKTPPQYGPPPQYEAPQYGAPQYAAPQYGAPPQYGPQYGAPPQYGAYGYAQQQYGAPPTYDYASWGARVGASLLDGLLTLPITILMVAGFFVLFAGAEVTEYSDGSIKEVDLNSGGVTAGVVLIVLSVVGGLAFTIWNVIVRQGRTGQTIGKKWVGITTIGERTGQPLGVSTSFLRYLLASILTSACFLNVLWPLWSDKKQCWHDMIINSVVIRQQ